MRAILPFLTAATAFAQTFTVQTSGTAASLRGVWAVTDQIVLPREAMGPADVTVMAAIGSFLGWPAVLFSWR